MDNLVDIVGLKPILARADIEPVGNFEVIYTAIHAKDPRSPVLADLEEAVNGYFSSLEMPTGPTLYDHLLMSLRPKDVVATFNWDPFLADACARVGRRGVPLPMVAFLHGNVRVGYCPDHIQKGALGTLCSKCGKEFTPTRLLYPVAEKDYGDPFIDREWKLLRGSLKKAFTLTIFGYGAPATDRKAVAMMKVAWSGDRERKMEQTEVIERPGMTQYEMRERWNAFTFSGHFDPRTDFYESCIGMFPRRSCEVQYERTYRGRYTREPRTIPTEADWPELLDWFKPLLGVEREVLGEE